MENLFDKIVGLVIFLNILAYLIKYILKKKGYPVSWFSAHLRDIPNFWRLIIKTKKTGEKLIYFVLGTIFSILTVVFVIFVFANMKDFAKVDGYDYEEQFRKTQWNGIVTDKYIDKPNHSYQTIEIKDGKNLKTIQNWVLFQNGNFEKIEIGDSIVKKQGLVNVKLYKQGEELELIVDYAYDEKNNSKRW